MSAILKVSLQGWEVVGFARGGDTLVIVVVVLIIGGGETIVGVDSAVEVRITGGVGITTGIVVGRTLVIVSNNY